jgi:hypothetical protein
MLPPGYVALHRVMSSSKVSCLLLLAASGLLLAGSTAADTPAGYGASLANVYGGYIRIAALKEACDVAVPATRATSAKAYAGWEAQHRALLQDLQQRVHAMIRGNSRDKDEYVRNIGKYEGEILLQRKEYRDDLLTLGKSDLRQQCEHLPEMLKSPGADLARTYAADLKVIRAYKYQ